MATRADFFEFAGLHQRAGFGLELGVAGGGFLQRCLKHTGMFMYGVDSWDTSGHGVDEYRQALKITAIENPRRTCLLRMQEHEACPLFPDSFGLSSVGFDFGL